jgi:hypothetical protein
MWSIIILRIIHIVRINTNKNNIDIIINIGQSPYASINKTMNAIIQHIIVKNKHKVLILFCLK